MFSRIARPVSKNVSALPSCIKVLNLGSVRFDSTSAANLEYFKNQIDEANTKALKARDEGVIGQFGWIPFWGMVGVIAISKEIVVADPALMLAACFGTWSFSAYVLAGESLTSGITQLLADNKTMFDKATDYQIEKMRVYKAKTQVEVDTVPVLQEMLKQQRAVEKNFLAAQNLEQRHALRQAILDKLNQIKVREDAEAALERSLLIDKAVANVYKAFETDDGSLQESSLDCAIALLGTDGMTTLEADPVKKLFVKEFQ